jgi:hypothetical protein
MLYYVLFDTKCLDAKMVKLKIGKPSEVEEEETITKQDDVREESVEMLQKLMIEEANLMEEKKNLSSLRKKLLSKVKEEIDNKKDNIQKLRLEIKGLKFSCEELSKSFKTGAKVK